MQLTNRFIALATSFAIAISSTVNLSASTRTAPPCCAQQGDCCEGTAEGGCPPPLYTPTDSPCCAYNECCASTNLTPLIAIGSIAVIAAVAIAVQNAGHTHHGHL